MDMIRIETTEILQFEPSTKPDRHSMPWAFEAAFMQMLKACGWDYRDAEYEYNLRFRLESTARRYRYGCST